MAYVPDKARPDVPVDRQLTGKGEKWKRVVAVPAETLMTFNPPLQAILSHGGSGNIVIENNNGDVVTIAAANAVTPFTVEIRRILATTTTTGIVGAS